jgi:Pyruvate/2-oxoacid:ferredoxin oxidoreductase gamma subunit
MPSLLPEGAVAVRFHSIGGWGAITTGKNLGAILGDLNDLLYERDHEVDALGNPKEVIHVSANPKYGSEKKGAPTSYFMVAAKDRIRVNCDLRHVTVVLCCDPKAFTHTNPLDGMQEGGCLVWESDVDGRTCPSGRASRLSKRRFAYSRCPVSKSRAKPPTAPICNCACRAMPFSARSSPSAPCCRSSASRRSSSATSSSSST